jgi:hypothetical protein
MRLQAKRHERRLHLITILAVFTAVATMPALASAQNPPPGSAAPPGGYQGGGAPGTGMGGGGNPGGGTQGNLGGGGMNNNQVQMTVTALTAGINLTNKQQTQLSAIRDQYAPQIQLAQSQNNSQLVQQLVQQRSASIRNMLTSSQQSTFDNNVQTIQANMNNTQGNGVQY